MLLLCDRFNCTPMQAIRELRYNPFIVEIMRADQYRTALDDVNGWDDMDEKQKRGKEPPGGYFAELAAETKFRLLFGDLAEREEARAEAGM